MHYGVGWGKHIRLNTTRNARMDNTYALFSMHELRKTMKFILICYYLQRLIAECINTWFMSSCYTQECTKFKPLGFGLGIDNWLFPVQLNLDIVLEGVGGCKIDVLSEVWTMPPPQKREKLSNFKVKCFTSKKSRRYAFFPTVNTLHKSFIHFSLRKEKSTRHR
jgi:hypothetical protein